jgi:threonine dehydratase
LTTPGALTFPILKKNVTEIALVSDDEIRMAVRFMVLRTRVVVEPTGAVSAAAVLTGKLKLDPGSAIGVVLSGANIDPELLVSLLHASPPADESAEDADKAPATDKGKKPKK